MSALMGTAVLVTGPTKEPVHLTEAKNHLRVTGTDEDALISALIVAAREHAEDRTGRALVTQTWDLYLDGFPCDGEAIEIPRPPLVSVSSITYVDSNGDAQTLATSVYSVDTVAVPGLVHLAYNQTWPTVRDIPNAVTIRYIAGHATPVTADAGTDILTASGRTFSNGAVVRLTNSGGALPTGLSADTDYYVRDSSASTFKLAATSGGAAIDITGAGSGNTFVGAVPPKVRAGILIHIGDLFENREQTVVGKTVSNTNAIEQLYGSQRAWFF